ncbi:cation transporting ATPase C-terminal domain-containing protein [Thiocapsa rosea]|uniref:cation transporting ATPase C-terminal domain-containing protein n=1 Tax=Thiocapsa rosea TaxID=69360 RepID=UPI000EB4A4EC|nr:cation transporting ATPase C-terminal domain-containing protein [Thiocapsa rosea]
MTRRLKQFARQITLFTYAPPMQAVFHTDGLDLDAWGLILGLSVFAFFAMVIEKGILRRLGIERM